MRNLFVAAITEAAKNDERIVFLSGDLGFKALEPLRDSLGPRFINTGVAEQNMVSVAAGMASKGFRPWVYSITPFITLRPYEQLRNDVCLHKLPVRVVGNGGGFGYGIMGATHHALEDIACMSLLPHMQIAVPAFAEDVADSVQWAAAHPGPIYLRLGKALSQTRSDSSPVWRTLAHGSRAVALSVGPVVGELLAALESLPKNSIEVLSISRLPLKEIPEVVLEKIASTGRLVTLEEHYATGGLGQAVAALVLGKLPHPARFLPLSASGYPSGKYGSQTWHLKENGLAGASLANSLCRFLETKDE